MSNVFIVIESLEDWSAYYPSEEIITFNDYVDSSYSYEKRGLVINLCDTYNYLDKSYYCSLIAEARGQRVIPSLETISTLNHPQTYNTPLNHWSKRIDKNLTIDASTCDDFHFDCFFGETQNEVIKNLAKHIFSAYPIPIMRVELKKLSNTWTLNKITPIQLKDLKPEQEDLFASALDQFTKKVWRKPRTPKNYRYDLAILYNPTEKLPPSNKKALQNFIKAGKKLGIEVDLIQPSDFYRLSEYDALFIRETTSTVNHTYAFASKAQKEDMVVIDDPQSILRCTNKVYLAKLLEQNGIHTPKTMIIADNNAETMDHAVRALGLPIVLKVPDGSFSVGIEKANTVEEFHTLVHKLLSQSQMIIAQEYLYTEYDWRIGVLAKAPLFACQYFMVKNHWQIYQHQNNAKTHSGNFQCFDVQDVPKAVIRTAVKAANLIGSGLYGVDLKFIKDKVYVIEINDNPNIDAGVEDIILGDAVYDQVLNEFVRRLEMKRLSYVATA